jgi:hypothetical protein
VKVCVLGTGSAGNATLVEAGGTRILVDAGFSGREMERRICEIGLTPSAVNAIVVTIDLVSQPLTAAFLESSRSLVGIVNPPAGSGDIGTVNTIIITVDLIGEPSTAASLEPVGCIV